MNRSFVAAAVLAASLSTAPLAAQGEAVAVPPADPAGDVVPGGVLPPAPTPVPDGVPEGLPGPTPGIPTGDAPAADPTLPAPAVPAPAAPATPAVPAPAPAPAIAQSFTDADVSSFARAVIAIDPIQADATLDETARQAKMGEALTSAGITVDTFNAMAVQSRTDAALKARIQTQIAAIQSAQPPAG